jgi:signal peptidase I
LVLSKGDNNLVDDRGLYAEGQMWLEKEHFLGRAYGFLPYVGIITIVMTDNPLLKYVLIGFLALLVFTNKE